MSRIIGIDPGAGGAITLLINTVPHVVRDMPSASGITSASELAELLTELDPDVVVLEDTQPMPKNGSIASFQLGMNTGIVVGVVGTLQHPLVRIRPVDWKRANGLIGKEKDASRHLARELWPHMQDQLKRKLDVDRADAMLIARAHIIRSVKEANGAREPDRSAVV